MTKKFGTLTLIPTPIAQDLPLEPMALALLSEACEKFSETSVFVVEDPKPGRTLWLRSGLPREFVEKFSYLNEHNAQESTKDLLAKLHQGKNIFLMSDGGLPAFCDPGTELVDLCHKEKIAVKLTPFPHSVGGALALSGYKLSRYHFFGFLPKESGDRKILWKEILGFKEPKVIMDTAYRLKRTLEEAQEVNLREIFLCADLNGPSQIIFRGAPKELLSRENLAKLPFIMVIP